MISNDNSRQNLRNIGDDLLNIYSQLESSKQLINRKDKENYIEIKKVVECLNYKQPNYHSRAIKKLPIIKKTNINQIQMYNCENSTVNFTKTSVKQLSNSKENLLQNQNSDYHNFRCKSNSPQLTAQNYLKCDNINIQFIQNYGKERIKNITEGLQSKIYNNLKNKIKHRFIQYSQQIQSSLLLNQNIVSNDQNQIYFNNSCQSLKEFFHQKSIELKLNFLEQQSQIFEEKLQIMANKTKTIQSTKKSLSSSHHRSMHTPKTQMKSFNRECNSQLRFNNNDSYKSKLNLVSQQNCSNNDNHRESQSIENSLEDNNNFSLNKKFDAQHFFEMKNQNLSQNQISIYSPKSKSSNVAKDERNSPLVLSNKVNRYLNLIQSFQSFHNNQTQQKQEIEIFDSIQVNDLDHISEFSIFKDEKQNQTSKIEQQRSIQNMDTDKAYLLQSNQQYNQRDLQQDHFNEDVQQNQIEQTNNQNFEFSLISKQIIMQKKQEILSVE